MSTRSERRLAALEAVARSRTVEDTTRAAGRALRAFAPAASVEVRLGPTRVHDPQTDPGCAVPTPDACPAVRQAAVLEWADPRSFAACPWLAARDDARSAVCAPVAVGGRGVGLLHVVWVGTGTQPAPGPEAVAPGVVADVAWLGAQVGALLDGLEVPVEPVPRESVPAEPVPAEPVPPHVVPARSASTDTGGRSEVGPVVDLTDPQSGIDRSAANGPSVSEGVPEARVPAPAPEPWPGEPMWTSPGAFTSSLGGLAAPYVLVLGAVDDPASLTRSSGPAAVEAAVGALAVALSADPDPLGPAALAACSRLDESTIAVAWSGLALGRSVEVLEMVRGELHEVDLDGAPSPARWSFGLTHSSVSADPSEVVSVARAGLDRARGLGGDQIVYADRSLLDDPPTAV